MGQREILKTELFLSQSITIRFRPGAGDRRFQDVHRFRNCAEELSLSLKRSELGALPMDEADAATTQVRVVKIAKRDVRRCLALIEQVFEKHHMTGDADVMVDE